MLKYEMMKKPYKTILRQLLICLLKYEPSIPAEGELSSELVALDGTANRTDQSAKGFWQKIWGWVNGACLAQEEKELVDLVKFMPIQRGGQCGYACMPKRSVVLFIRQEWGEGSEEFFAEGLTQDDALCALLQKFLQARLTGRYQMIEWDENGNLANQAEHKIVTDKSLLELQKRIIAEHFPEWQARERVPAQRVEVELV